MNEKICSYIDSKRDDILRDIRRLVKIESVVGQAEDGCPFGRKCADALLAGEDICKNLGLVTENCDNYAVRADFDRAKETKLGVLAHLDVVEQGKGWTYPAFDMTQKDGVIYGRGVADDKGPAVAAMYAFAAVKELFPELKYNASLILGSAEETGSEDIKYYFSKNETPPMVFSPDADYPVINTEKGRVKFKFSRELNAPENRDIVSFCGGETINVVPPAASAEVSGVDIDKIRAAADEFAASTGAKFSVSENGGNVKVLCMGENAHAAQPQTGINAQTALISLLCSLGIESERSAALAAIEKIFPHGETDGFSAEIRSQHEKFGALTCSFDVLGMDNNKISGGADIRYPVPGDADRIVSVLADEFKNAGFSDCSAFTSNVHHTDENSPFIKELLSVYEDYTGKPGECLAIGGGTYVHNIDGGAAFGCAMPGVDNRMHSADEFSYVDDLIMSAKMFAEVIADACGGKL